MGKYSKFEKHPRGKYFTPEITAGFLLPHLASATRFIEPLDGTLALTVRPPHHVFKPKSSLDWGALINVCRPDIPKGPINWIATSAHPTEDAFNDLVDYTAVAAAEVTKRESGPVVNQNLRDPSASD